MTSQLNIVQKIVGTSLLGGSLVFGGLGMITHAQELTDPPYVKDEFYIEECGACHLAYPPSLLPEQSWHKIMQSLEDHFGENAELDEESEQQISTYLHAHALTLGNPTTVSEMIRHMPEDPPLRITEFPGFIDAHRVVGEQLDMKEFPESFLSPCADCHRQAADGIFEKDRMHPGYGPSAWGGGDS